jgi:hypothetical protein
MPQMSDWADTVSELATGVGTLVLAVATFAAVRSANRSARTAEASMRAAMRPVLMHSRLNDPQQKIAYGDGKWVAVPGGGAAAEAADGAVYLALSVRNAGTGMAILHGWRAGIGRVDLGAEHTPLDRFTPQSRDMYVAAGDVGFWQGALRDPQHELFAEMSAAVADRQQLWVELLYGDFEGGQRVVSRFNLAYADGSQFRASAPAAGDPSRGRPAPDGSAHGSAVGRWLASVVRHWNVDRPDPR